MTDKVAEALKLIQARGVMRTPELAVKIGIEEHELDALLDRPQARPFFVTCSVELAGGKRVIEYRCSATGGRYGLGAQLAERASACRAQRSAAGPVTGTERPAALESGESRSARATPTPALAADQPRETTMTNREAAIAAFEKHGPMTIDALSAYVKTTKPALYQCLITGEKAKPQHFARLGGGKRSTIWGLPTQTIQGDALERGADLGRRSADKPPRSLHRAKKSHAGGGSAAMRKRRVKKTRSIPMKPLRKAQARRSAFRPAIASDGALLLLGAKGGDFELSREETRTVLQLVRRLQPAETGELLGFLVRLDAARVGG